MEKQDMLAGIDEAIRTYGEDSQLLGLRESLNVGAYNTAATFLSFIESDEEVVLPQGLKDAVYCRAARWWMDSFPPFEDLAVRHYMVIIAGQCLSLASVVPEDIRKDYDGHCNVIYGEKVKDPQERALIDAEFFAMRGNFENAIGTAMKAGLHELAYALEEERQQRERWEGRYRLNEEAEKTVKRHEGWVEQDRKKARDSCWNPDAPYEDIEDLYDRPERPEKK